MATSDQSKYSTEESEVNKSACCSPCLEDGRNISARHYCVDCEMYFCTKCLKYHNKYPALRKHQVNDLVTSVSSNEDEIKERGGNVSSHSLRCQLHEDKRIDTYCKNHDEVFCATCAVFKHIQCTTEPIAIAAVDFKSNPEVNKCKESLVKILAQFNEEKATRKENIDSISKQKLELMENLDKYEEEIIKKIKELANKSRQEIRSKYEEHKVSLDNDVESLDVVIKTTSSCVEKLQQNDDDEVLFINVKSSKMVANDGEILVQSMKTDWRKRAINFHLDKTLNSTIDRMKAFGRLGIEFEVKEYEAAFLRNVNIKQGDDGQEMYVFDMCFSNSGDLLLTDHYNSKVIRLNSELQFKDEIQLSGYPVAVCKTDEHEVAVRIWSSKVVHFVSVGQTLQLKSSFTLGDNGYGMTYDVSTGEILACEENKVSVYSKSGTKLRTYDKNTNGEQMFSDCSQIALNVSTQDIYVTDYNKGLIVLDKNGNMKMTVTPLEINHVWSLCFLPVNICLVGDTRYSGVIFQIDKDGKQLGKLIDTNDGRAYTYCTLYDREHSRLIVGSNPVGISIYTLSAK